MKLELWRPISPYNVNQPFGANPEYYSKFLDKFGNPEKGHMGMDLMGVHGHEVYAPIEGDAYYIKDEHGGEGVYIRTGLQDYASGSAYFNVILWHMVGDTDPQYPPPIPMGGVITHVKVGDLVGYADNTGAPFESSGSHLHLGLMPCDANYNPTEPGNGFGGCINPEPYINAQPATDAPKELAIISTATAVIALLKKLLGYT